MRQSLKSWLTLQISINVRLQLKVRDLRLMQKYYFHNVTIGKQKKWNFGKSFLSLWKILFQSYDGTPST